AGRRAADARRARGRRPGGAGGQRAQRDLPVPGLQPRRHPGHGRPGAHPADRLGRTVPRPQPRGARRRHSGAGGRAPQVVHGPEDLRGLGDADEQGPGSDRGPPPVRHARRPHRRAGAPAEPGAFAGGVQRRLDPGAARPARHAHRAGGGPGLAGPHPVGRRRARPAAARPPRLRAPGPRCVPVPPARLRGAGGRRDRAGGAQRRQRSRGFMLPSGPDRFSGHPRAGRGLPAGLAGRTRGLAGDAARRRCAGARPCQRPHRPGTCMSSFLGSVWWMIVSIGVLVTFHEFGHYWVARRCGVRVLRFSVGFGKPLWLRRGRDGTEYVFAAIPLGGYVKMLDEREADVPEREAGRAFNRKPVWQRIAIVAAGPLANLLLCVLFLWAMFVIGRPDYAPVVGHAEGIAAAAGLHEGDTLVAVGGRATPTWSEAAMALTTAAMDREDVDIEVRTAGGAPADRKLALSRLPADTDERRAVQAMGLTPRHFLLPPVIGRVEPGSAAWGVLAEGDRITAIDASPVDDFADISPLLQAIGGEPAMVEVERDGDRLALEVTPQ